VTRPPQRIVSLLPAATESLFALGLGSRVVGVSHECDHPEAARKRPRVSRARIDAALPSRELDQQVRAVRARGESLYELDAAKIASLEPDLVVTQVQCEVCAVSPKDLEKGLADCDPRPPVLTLESQSLENVFQDIFLIGKATGTEDEAKAELFHQWGLVKQVRSRVRDLPRRRAAVLDWIHPLMFAGNWIPELVSVAGGHYDLVDAASPSRWGRWDELRKAAPDTIVLAACGRDAKTTAAEWSEVLAQQDLGDVPAVRNQRVFAADGHNFFNRPGPRLVFSAALLARAIHPEVPPLPPALESGLVRLGA
jgi:iron complex transport system substrate-binding protein